MRIRSPASALSVLLAATLLANALSGCQQLFTTSLAKSLARGSISLPSDLSPSQASDLAKQAKENGDTKLANALVSALVGEIATTTDPGTQVELEAAAASAAITASGLGSSLADFISTLSGGSASTIDTQSLIDLVAKVQSSSSVGVLTALDYLTQPSMSTTASGLSATDYVIAAAVVAASYIPPGTDPTSATYNPAEQTKITGLVNDARSLVTPGSPEDTLISGILSVVNQ
jgi:hypothetical protein